MYFYGIDAIVNVELSKSLGVFAGLFVDGNGVV